MDVPTPKNLTDCSLATWSYTGEVMTSGKLRSRKAASPWGRGRRGRPGNTPGISLAGRRGAAAGSCSQRTPQRLGNELSPGGGPGWGARGARPGPCPSPVWPRVLQ